MSSSWKYEELKSLVTLLVRITEGEIYSGSSRCKVFATETVGGNVEGVILQSVSKQPNLYYLNSLCTLGVKDT